jgi:hypothetical protein
MPTLHINTGFHRQIFEHDRMGNTIYAEKSSSINVCIPSEIETACGKLPFTVVVKVEKSSLKNENDADDVAISWLHETLASDLSKSNYWDFFEYKWLECKNPVLNSGQLNKPLQRVVLVLTNKLEEQIQIDLALISMIKISFDGARNHLDKLAFNSSASGFSYSFSEASASFRTLEKILSFSANVGSYGVQECRAALEDYRELAKRSNESHHGYKTALQSLQRFVLGVDFPKFWRAKPNV